MSLGGTARPALKPVDRYSPLTMVSMSAGALRAPASIGTTPMHVFRHSSCRWSNLPDVAVPRWPGADRRKVMSINRFPFQDDVLRELAKGPATAAKVSNAIASEGRAPGHGENSVPSLHRMVAENIDHLVNLGVCRVHRRCPAHGATDSLGRRWGRVAPGKRRHRPVWAASASWWLRRLPNP